MDPATVALLVSTLAGIWTAYQEYRHQKAKKPSDSMSDALGAKPMRGKK